MTIQRKPRLLTGDTPTGKLHLGHLLGSLENRVRLQDQYECYILLADLHAFTINPDQSRMIRDHVIHIVLDYLSVGIDPQKTVVFVESDVPAIYELSTIFSMLISYARLMRNPTLKNEIQEKKIVEYSMGFLNYPILQVADILALQAHVVPVGVDQIPHLELTREVARRFYQKYAALDSDTQDAHPRGAQEQDCGSQKKEIFPIPQALLGRAHRLIGIGAPNADGSLIKMSKSLNNAIFLSDTPDVVAQKVMGMYTDPKRVRATDLGTTDNNPLWIFHQMFHPDPHWVQEHMASYRLGTVSDVACKKELIDVLNSVLDPIRKRRAEHEDHIDCIHQMLKTGAESANHIANDTLRQVKKLIHQDYTHSP